MTDDAFERELQASFAKEDAALEATPFVDQINRRIDRSRRLRRLVLAGTGLVGAAFALFQLPGLLGQVTPTAAGMTERVTTPLRETASAAASDPVWMAVAGALAITWLLLATFERA